MSRRPDQGVGDEIPEPTGIVSVNSRGGASSGMAPKLALALLVLGLLVVGAVMGVNRYRAQQTGATPANKAPAVEAGRQRRIFNTDPPLPPPARQAPAASAAVPAPAAGCADGEPARPLLAPDGQPIPDVNGQPIQVCASGHIATTSPQPPGIEAGAQSTPPLPGAASAQANRYGGELLLPAQPSALPSGSTQTASLPEAGGPAASGFAYPVAAMADARAGTASAGGHRATGASMATLTGDRDLLLPEGRSIECSLTVRLVTEVDGRASCVLTSHAYSDSGRVVLAERGSVVTGEYRALMAQGQRRLFVLWTRLRTPNGVVIELASPAADALGTAGLPGHIDNRWRERIGAAVLLSLIEDAISYQTAKASAQEQDGRREGNVGNVGIAVFDKSTETGRNLAERILDSTINIKPTLYKNQGDRATIIVARDLDFGSVYALRAQ